MSWMYELPNEERWSSCDDGYDTKEEAIQAGREFMREEYPDYDSFEVGKKVIPVIPSINAYSILETTSENMYWDVGEIAEDWLSDVNRKEENNLEERLNSVFLAWLEETGNMPTFWKVVNVENVLVDPE